MFSFYSIVQKIVLVSGLLASGVVPLPLEMTFPLEKHEDWHHKYDYIKFPSDKKTSIRQLPNKKVPVEKRANKNGMKSVYEQCFLCVHCSSPTNRKYSSFLLHVFQST